MKKVLGIIMPVVSVMVPAVAFAQLNTGMLDASLRSLIGTVNIVVALMLAVEAVVFIYGVIRYILARDPEAQTKAKSYIVWSLIAIAVTAAVWGIVNLLISFLGIQNNNLRDIPKVQPNV